MNHYHTNSTQSNCEEIIEGCCSSSSSIGSTSSSLASSPQQTQTLPSKMITSSSGSTKPIYINSYASSTNSTESSPVPYSTSLSSYKIEPDYENDEMMNHNNQQNDDEYLDSSSMSDDMMHDQANNNNLNYSINNNGGNGRTNRFFPDAVVDILNKWFYENQDYPYPDENMTNVLAKEANISAKQVRKWFANKRVRSNKCYRQTSKGNKKENIKSRRQTKSISDADMNQYSYGINQHNYLNTNYNSSISSDNESLYQYETSYNNQQSKSALIQNNKKVAYIKPKPCSSSNSTSSSFNSSSLLNDSSNYNSNSHIHRSTSAYSTQEFLYNLNMWKNAMENGQNQHQYSTNNRNDDQTSTQFNLDLNNQSTNNNNNNNYKCSTTLMVTNHFQSNNTNANTKSPCINNTAAVVAAALSNPILLVNLLQQQSQQQNLSNLINQQKENINNTSTDNSYNETDSANMFNSSLSSNGSPSSSSIVKRKTQLSNSYMKESTDQAMKRSNSFIEPNTSLISAAAAASSLLEKYITNASSPIKSTNNFQNIYSSPIPQSNSNNHVLLNSYQQYYYQMQQHIQQQQQQQQLNLTNEPKRKTKINFGDVSDLVN